VKLIRAKGKSNNAIFPKFNVCVFMALYLKFLIVFTYYMTPMV